MKFCDHALFVTEVATSSPSAGNVLNVDALSDDNTFGVRQVDLLIKTLLFNLACPVPLPNNAPKEAGGIALYSLTEYGRVGGYPSFGDTTEYRLCRNAVRSRFKVNLDNLPLVNAISAMAEKGNHKCHQRLRDELRDRSFLNRFYSSRRRLSKRCD